jgi:hypothetical protein
MYALPNWEIEILKQINKFKSAGIERYTISCCLIEPLGNNPEYTVSYHGHDANSFKEESLLNFFLTNKNKIAKSDTIQYSHPILFTKKMIEEVGYLDEKYFPGWSLDHDMPMSFYEKGCRNFIMLGNSRVYHFISKTFTKLPTEVKNRNGLDIFLEKWKISVDQFRKNLKIAEPWSSK